MEHYIERQDLSEAGVLIRKIVETECLPAPAQEEKIQEMKASLFERHSSVAKFVQDMHVTLESITTVLESTKAAKAEKDKVLKKSTCKKIELMVEALVHQETRRREGVMKQRQEFAKLVPEMNRKIIECAGELLNFAKASPMHFPFMVHTIRQITLLAAVFDCFVPMSFYLLHMMSHVSQVNASSAPLQPIAEDAVKVQEKHVNTKVYKEYVLSRCLDLIAAHLRIYSNSLGFPEYACFIAQELKRIRNSPHRVSQWITGKMENISKAIKEHSDLVTKTREGLSIMDEEAIRKLEEKIPSLEISTE
ncbi:hypothetical protein NECID01_0467 [Nematocida sp. AWRm77]|nr:hypothetical protein NECID01_0467 [Nematocida sp. AWRm77]